MVRQRFAVALVAIVAGCVVWCSQANAQDSSGQPAGTMSYDDLMSRVNSLEQRVQSMSARQQPVTPLVGSRYGGLFVNYENVIVKPFFSRDDVAEETDFGDYSKTHGFSWDMKYSPRVEIGYLSEPGGIGFRARYWNFDQEANRNIGSTNSLIVEIQSDPTIYIDGVTRISAQHALKVNTFDAEATTRIRNFGISGGLRVAEIQNHYYAAGFDAAGALTNVVQEDQNFTGLGPTASLDYRLPFGNLPLNLFISTRGSAIYGNRRVNAISLLGPGGDTGNRYERGVDDLVLISELQMGFESFLELYDDHFFFLRIGAEAQYWVGGGTGYISNVSDTVGEGRPSDPADANLGFVGLMISTGLIW